MRNPPGHLAFAMMRYRCCSLLLHFVAIACVLVASDPARAEGSTIEIPPGAPLAQYFDPTDYQDSAQVWAITQDHRGVMYFGTANAVLEFDGRRWRSILMPDKATVRSLSTSADGTVYVGSVGEFGYLASDAAGNTVYRSLSVRIEDPRYQTFNYVWSTHATTHGVYYVTYDIIFRWYQGRLEVIDSPTRNWGFSIGDEVIVYHRESGGLSRLFQGRLVPLPNTEKLSSETTGRLVIAPHGNDGLIIFTTKLGTYRYARDSAILESMPS